MKRNLFLFLFLCFFAQVSLSAKSHEAQTEQEQNQTHFSSFTGKIIGDKVRMRLHPNLEGHIVRESHKGEIYAVVCESEDYYGVVPADDMKAYIYRTYILDNKVEADHVNVRLHPNLEAPIVAQLNSGDKVTVTLTPEHSKWYEIAFPKDVTFWVAKEYVDNIGSVEYAEKYHERVAEAQQILATAALIKESEFRKNFQEIDLKRLVQNFEKIARDYKDLEKVNLSALDAITQLEKEYCTMKIDFLEGKAGQAELQVESLNAKLSNFDSNDIEFNQTQVMNEIQVSQFTLNFPKEITDKMKIWQPIESSLFMAWASDKEETTPEHFYGEETLSSEKLTGMVEPFAPLIKYRPGDYVMTSNGQTVAYLYSTHVNLQDMVGKKVSLKVAPRDNHNFAFPAYYVLEIED